MKKIVLYITVMLMLLSFVGCDFELKNGNDSAEMFEATVIEVRENGLIVEPFEEYKESKSSDRIFVSLKNICLDEINTGDTVEVYYEGGIQESDPAVANKVISVKKTDQGAES